MRKTIGLGLTTIAFALGLMIGAVDSRTAHVVVSTAQARPKAGGAAGGCDGQGTPPSCATCLGGNCIPVCVGRSMCVLYLDRTGEQICLDGRTACASGGSGLFVGGGIAVY